MARELCLVATPKGPCTLPKGHSLKYHRHRTYSTITWVIENQDGIVLENGQGRVELNYAIARCMEENKYVTIHLKEWNAGATVNDAAA